MTPKEFPKVFATGWALPKPDGFLEFFIPMIASDAVFVQPSFGEARGPVQVAHMFRQLFTLFPDLATTPRHSAVSGDIVFIESICTATVGSQPIQFSVCDRFVIRDGQIHERMSHSDAVPTALAIARSPRAWPRAIRSKRM